MRRFAKGNLTKTHLLFVGAMFVLPLLIALGKCGMFPGSEFLERIFSLDGGASSMQSRLRYVLFVPFGAMIIVFFRLFLGIRILGPFRSILLAVAFQITGVLAGCAFLAVVTGVIVCIRPVLKRMRLPYFARVSVILSTVACIMIMMFVVGRLLGASSLNRLIYFPIFALCLTGEGFARTLKKEGTISAFWRGGFTVLVAVLITLAAQSDLLRNFLMHYPEMLIVQVAAIILIAEVFDLRLFQSFNPPAKKRKASVPKMEREETEQFPDFGLLEA